MFIDAEQLADRSTIESRVVIVGGGIAGIALARQLADAGVDVAILESGAEQVDDRTQNLYAGAMTVGDANGTQQYDRYLTESRVRAFGGSGNVWGGKCAPLDPMDFERREWVPHSGWPIDRAALQPFYDRACDLLELPRFPAPAAPGADPLLGSGARLFTPRTRAYTRYTGGIPNGPYAAFKRGAAEHARIRVYLNANVTRIVLQPDGGRVASLEVGGFSGRRHTARAESYILATGGIENVRLLLASNDVQKAGIGNHSDWLGRGFQGHTTIFGSRPSLWALRAPGDLAPYNPRLLDRPHMVIGISDEAQRRGRALNFTTTLAGNVSNPPRAALSVHALARRLAGAAADAHRGIYFMVEHAPNRDSRIGLNQDERDPLGMPRVRIDMRHAALELESLERSVSELGRELGRLGAGRLHWADHRTDWQQSMSSLSRHHMGATRTSVSPRDGVVDEHARVHGVGNLYVAGSSVFPTSGIANPTLTLLALALRMGDRLIASKGGSA